MKLDLSCALLIALLCSACTFHSTARIWNERVGPNGEPIWVKSTSNVGLNLFVFLKVAGATDIGGMIGKLTEEIADEGGDRVRIIQSERENYWHGFPPLTWILTPVITTVAADYEPSEVPASEREPAQ